MTLARGRSPQGWLSEFRLGRLRRSPYWRVRADYPVFEVRLAFRRSIRGCHGEGLDLPHPAAFHDPPSRPDSPRGRRQRRGRGAATQRDVAIVTRAVAAGH